MGKVKCILRKRGLERGRATVEWYKDGIPQYYCYGQFDRAPEEPLLECRNCRDFVERAQEDLEDYLRERKKVIMKGKEGES